MPPEQATLIKDDQDHLIHPLHHPSDHLEPLLLVRGRGAVITDIQGREYLDGLAGLWNVNVGHGREELAQAAAHQISELAYYSAYTGSSNIPAIQLASKLISIAYPNMQGVFFTSGGAESNESAFKTARFYWKAKGKPDKVKIIARSLAYHGVTLQAMSATGMSAYWNIRTGKKARSPERRPARRRRGCSKRRSCARGPTRWLPSSPSRSTAAAASSIRLTTTSRSCARCATATTCSSSPTR